MTFLCSQCGLCCKYLYRALDKSRNPKWMHGAIDEFPHETKPDGSCEKLVNNLCSVFDERPTLCNISEAAEKIDMPMTKDQWYAANYAGCFNLAREEDRLNLRIA